MNKLSCMVSQLQELLPEQIAVVVRIDDCEDTTALRRLGFNEGVTVQIMRTGSPALVLVDNAKIAVDPKLLKRVEVCTF